MKLPNSWVWRRRRRLQHKQYAAISRIGLSTAGSPVAGETALCIAYMCPWAHACPAATPRPALVGQRQCLRMYTPERRPAAGLSDLAMDVLAVQRDLGERLGPVTTALLDQFRPKGPTPSLRQRRPERPVYTQRVSGRLPSANAIPG